MNARSVVGGLLTGLAVVWPAEPAFADSASCYVSRTGDYGEIIVTVSGGARDEAPLAWAPAPQRRLESDHFAPPGLMLEYSGLVPERLTRPVSAQILVSRVADSTLGPGPSIESLSVRATLQSGMVMLWSWRDRREAEARLARNVEHAGERLVIELLGPDRQVLASSSFLIRPDGSLREALRGAGEEAGGLERSPEGECRARSGADS